MSWEEKRKRKKKKKKPETKRFWIEFLFENAERKKEIVMESILSLCRDRLFSIFPRDIRYFISNDLKIFEHYYFQIYIDILFNYISHIFDKLFNGIFLTCLRVPRRVDFLVPSLSNIF